MRRGAITEWGAIAALALAPTLLLYWAVSIALPAAGFEFFLPLGHWSSMQVVAVGGRITVNDHPGSSESIEIIQSATVFSPRPTGMYRLAAPGFRFRSVTWAGGPSNWSIDFSLLIPTFVMALMAAVCIRRYSRVRRMQATAAAVAGTSRAFQ